MEQPHTDGRWLKSRSFGKTISELVREGMQVYPRDTTGAAKALGLGRNTYQLVRRLLILTDRQTLPSSDQEVIDSVLAKINAGTIAVERAQRETQTIMDRHWIIRTKNGEHVYFASPIVKKRKKHKKRLENTLFAISEACGNNEELVIPQLTRDERANIVDDLLVSIKSLWDLMFKIRSMGE